MTAPITGQTIDGEETFTVPEGSFALPVLLATKRTPFIVLTFTRDGVATDTIRCRWNDRLSSYEEAS